MGLGVGHKGAFLTRHGEHPAGMNVAFFRFTNEVLTVRHGEADFQIVPVLSPADGVDGREVPAHFVGQTGLRDHLITAEQTTDVVPLAAAIGDLAARMKFQCAANSGRVAYFFNRLRAQGQWLVVQRIGHLHLIGGHKAIKIALFGQRLIKRFGLLAVGLCQLQAARLPVTPATGLEQVFWHPVGELMQLFPAAQAHQQPGAPFGHRVVAQLWIVFGHDRQRPGVEAFGQGQADFAGNGDLLLAGELHARSITFQQFQGVFRFLTRQSTQAKAHGISRGRVILREAPGLFDQSWVLRHVQQEFSLRAQGRQVLDQVRDQAIVARFGSEFGALPALLFGELAVSRPQRKERVAGVGLRFTHQPEFFGSGVAFAAHAVFQLVLAVQAIKLSEIQGRVVVIGEGLPLATFGQPAQPAQFHPVDLRQVAMFGEEFLNFIIAGPLQAGRELVISQVRLQWIVTQRVGIALIRALVALSQCGFGLVVILTLLRQGDSVGGGDAQGGYQQAGQQAE